MIKPQVAIFSDYNFLAVSILENLLFKKCFVTVYSKTINNWNANTSHLNKTGNFEILSPGRKKVFNREDYCIFVCGFTNKENLMGEISEISSYKFENSKKSILVLPLETFYSSADYQIIPSENLALVYVSDLLGPRINLKSNLLMNQLIGSAVFGGSFELPVGERFYPINVHDAARVISGWLFSFGPYGRKVSLVGSETPPDVLWKEIKSFIPASAIVYTAKTSPRKIPREMETIKNSCNLRASLKETLIWASRAESFRPYKPPRAKDPVKISLPKISPRFKKMFRNFTVTALAALSPFIFSLISVLFLKLARLDFTESGGSKTESLFFFSKIASVIGKKESAFLMKIPVANIVYRESYYINGTLEKASDLILVFSRTAKTTSNILTKTTGDSVYDLNGIIETVTPGLDYAYQTISSLEAETQSRSLEGVVAAKKVASGFDLSKYKKIVFQGSSLLKNLPNDLGVNGSKVYLILFQNNMELRPTGGFIGSYGLVTFEGGRMTDLSISDVYSADGQLKGHVEPPEPINKYLNEANWWLRDSNWDPDFPVSAKRAEWFLDKEIDRTVDGVVAIDLEVIKNLLSVVGPMTLSDYNLDINAENLYEKTQEEVENSFFPGSTKKASFLTALSRNLILELERLDSGKAFAAFSAIFTALEEKHIQLFTHNQDSQSAISELGWGGEVKVPSCSGPCYADLVGTVEANVGVNKSNLFITRNQNLEVEILGDRIRRRLSLSIKNSANPNLGPGGVYKAYIRLLANAGSRFNGVFLVSGQSEEKLVPDVSGIKDRLEGGVYIEVFPGQSKTLVFEWESDMPSPFAAEGEYRLYLRKQAGIDGFPVRINIANLSSLTGNTPKAYNTTLSGDYFSRVSW